MHDENQEAGGAGKNSGKCVLIHGVEASEVTAVD